MTRPRFLSGILAALFGASCSKGMLSSSRYHMATDLGSRHRSQHVQDRVTGQWVYREIELRVDTVRPLPDPMSDDQFGDRLSLQLFRPGSVQTGGLRSGTPVIEGGYRIWRGADALVKGDLDGRTGYGVSVAWPKAVEDGQGTRHDPMEIFPMDPIGPMEPGVWTEWFSARSLRAGAFAWWAEAYGKPVESLPRPEHPFEFRWRLMLIDVPRVP